jgi:hypothetical protein
VTIQSIAEPGAIHVSSTGNVHPTVARVNATVTCPSGYRPSSLGEQSWAPITAASPLTVAKTVNASIVLSDALRKTLVETCKTRRSPVAAGKNTQSSPMVVPVPVAVAGKCNAPNTYYGTLRPLTTPHANATAQVPVKCDTTYLVPSPRTDVEITDWKKK